jgi:serine/threonine protein kinase
MAQEKRSRRKPASIHDRLRALIGDMITEDELKQRLTFGRLLGTGATSKVYAAVDTATGDEVAVKVFDKAAMVEVRRSMVADGEYAPEKAVHRVRRRLLKVVSELEISQTLDHPNVIKYVGAYETSHRVCIVHELVEGGDLLEHLLANGKMSESRAASVFRQLLSALQYCHDRHVYHRDLKLENVLITSDGRVKLIDFGLSEVAAPGQTLTTICGTPLYCSPEVLFLHSTARRKGFFGGPADVWSVGVLMFALLTGCAPFDDSNFTVLREEIYRNTIAYPKHMSDQAKGLLKALLIFDAHLRPTVKDILAYGWFQQHATTGDSAVAAENPQPPSTAAAPDTAPRGYESPHKSRRSASPRRRSISCVSASSGTQGTSSSSGSFEDAVAVRDSPGPQQLEEEEAAAHLSCLEVA